MATFVEKSTVDYIDHMGTDLTVVNSARVSFDKHHEMFQEKDTGLIRYLARHGHWTPFSHATITLRETVPLFVARQRFKHVVGFSYNEVSRRYVDTEPEFFRPVYWRRRADDKKQGSGPERAFPGPLSLRTVAETALAEYNYLLACGVAPEQARMVLPQNTMTSYYVTGSLYAFFRAYALRADSHAQAEIQDVAHEWDKIIEPLFPVSWKALREANDVQTHD